MTFTQLTPQDCNRYIAMIRIEYPHAFQIQARDEKERTDIYTMLCASWYRQLEQYPKEVCDKAVMDALGNAREGRYPRIGDVKYHAEKLISAFEKSNEELWAELTGILPDIRRHASRLNATYVREDGYTQGDIARMWIKHIYNNLSPELKEYCRSQRELIEIADYDAEAMRYEKARFMRVIPTVKERAKVRREMPEQLAGIIQGLSGKLALGGDGIKQLTGG